ncbi:unnamed protein product [Heligmosomoides polygyrus]|uniref:FHA domain-containing protein n=1 Tax=Heligmosomoides polygyrus TaxID=6339 RepID=A0A183FKT2_HELPZ|nr:unnamed protein product [Heligmosomoides polygyrus]
MTSPSVKPVHMDRLPLPVTISSIKSKVLDGDHFLIGKKAFTKVLCAGRVVSSRHVRSLGAMEYVVADPMPGDNVAKDISLNDATNPAEQFPRSTLVLIPGKLVRFKGAIAIHAYSMRELICPDEYECLRMEAFLALQYHTKNPSGQTPVRRQPSSGGAPPPPRRSVSSSTPSTSVPGKRSTSPVTTSYYTPKRSTGSIRSASSDNLVPATKSNESAAPDRSGDVPKRADSQDSFEDDVFMKSD